MNAEGRPNHLEEGEVAAYVDGTLRDDERATMQAHLSVCAECRAEVVEVSRLVRSLPGRGGLHRRLWIPAAAAAVLALVVVGPRVLREPNATHRQEAGTTTVAPRALAPVGTLDSVATLMWSSVPDADRYQARLFDGDGAVLWEQEIVDTVVTLPASLRLRANRPYYWKVEAHTGFDRRAASELVEFNLRRDSGR